MPPDPTPEVWSPQVIRPGSLLTINVYVAGSRELEIANTRVSESGTVTLPIIGTLMIGGRQLRTAAQFIEMRYSEFFVSPQVTLDIVRDDDSDAFPWGFVTVLGRVKRQGRVSIPPTRDLTVSSAIQLAGGFDTSARITAIRVTRRLPNDDQQTFDVNMRKIGRRGKTDEDIRLMPNDVVFIPEMLF
jgi:polysaccharide biosynthesis/export protein